MNKVLCSTGTFIGRPNNRDFRLIGDIAKRLECDGLELMIYTDWYSCVDDLIGTVKPLDLDIPVIHCEKSLGELLSGATREWVNDGFEEHLFSESEDLEAFETAKDKLRLNLKVADALGADRMVLHLWNGHVSDRFISKNIERFGVLRDMARNAGVDLLVENVLCNVNNPLYDLNLVHKAYPDAHFIYDTKMAEFHGQLAKTFSPENEWLFKEGFVKHLHINDYNGGVMDWSNLSVLPIGKGHVDFDMFFDKLRTYGYEGDYTVEATALAKTGEIDYTMLNDCFAALRRLING